MPRSRSARLAFAAVALSAALGAPPAAAAELTVVVEAPEPESAFEGSLVAVPESGADEPTRVRLGSPGTRVVDLPDGRWVLGIEADSWWAPTRTWDSREPRRTIRFEPVPTVSVTGRLAVDDDHPVDALGARFLRRDSSVSREGDFGAASCSLGDRGAFDCALPVGALDLRLEPQGWAAVLRWNLEIRDGEATGLGTIPLVAASALRGTVIDAETGAPMEGAEIRLQPGVVGEVPLTQEQRFELAGTATRSRRGGFEISDLPPGSYDLRVAQEGWSPALLEDLRIEAGVDVALPDPVALLRPAFLEVFLSPGSAPDGLPWRINLLKELPDRRIELLSGGVPEADPDGYWSARDLAPGAYRIHVATERSPRWLEQRIVIDPGPNTVELSPHGVAVRGVLVAGDTPVAATLYFGGRSGERSIRMTSDELGRFEGFLPRDGEWPLDIGRAGLDGVQRLEPVEIRAQEGEAEELRIELPDTVVRGTVTDARGELVAEATVLLFDLAERRLEAVAYADEEGSFELLGIEPADLSIEAKDGPARSEPLAIRVEEGVEGPEIELVLRSDLVVRGVVVAAGGPVAGGRIRVLPTLETPSTVDVPSVVTGPDGRFEVALAPGSVGFQAILRAPGYPVTILTVAGLGTDPVVLEVPEVGGAVRISGGREPRERTILMAGGMALPLRMLDRFVGRTVIDGDDLVLPNMAPGGYLLCAVAPDGDRACSEAHLPAGSGITLTLPDEPPAPERSFR